MIELKPAELIGGLNILRLQGTAAYRANRAVAQSWGKPVPGKAGSYTLYV